MKKIIVTVIVLHTFVASSFCQVISNMDSWVNYTSLFTPLTRPAGWSASDSLLIFFGTSFGGSGFLAQIEKETPGNGGSGSALRVVTKNQPAIGTFFPAGPFPGIATNSKITFDISSGVPGFEGGYITTYNPTEASFYVKSSIQGLDSASVVFLAIDNSDGVDSIIGTAEAIISTTIPSFTKITTPFAYTATGINATLIRVIVTSGASDSVTNGTSITVDDVAIQAPSGVWNYLYRDDVAHVYPTQCSYELHVDYIDSESGYSLSIYDDKGSVITDQELTSSRNTVTVNQLSTGNYIYTLRKGNAIIQRGKFTKL